MTDNTDLTADKVGDKQLSWSEGLMSDRIGELTLELGLSAAELRKVRRMLTNATETLTKISTWTEDAHAYDKDMGYAPRDLCEDVEMIEAAAISVLRLNEDIAR